LLDALRKTDLAKHELGPAIRMMVPKHTAGYRCAAQLDPFDALLFSALVYELSPCIEAFRVPADRNVACAYRLDLKPDGQFFQRKSGWAGFHEQSKIYTDQSWCKYVVSADVSDFYNQISHHRIQNALASAGISENRSEVMERFLGNMNALHHSRGIPVGPTASILLAECALADVDNYLLRCGFRHTRYVDDFRIFCSSREEAIKALHDLSEYLFTAHRLSVQSGKSSLLTKEKFKAHELSDPEELERSKKTKRIGEIIDLLGVGEYGEPEFDVDEVEEEAVRDSVGQLFDEVLARPVLPIGLARYVLRRAGAMRTRIILQKSLEACEKLRPVLRDAVGYWCKVVDKKKPEQVGEKLKWLVKESPYRSLPYVQYWVLSAFEAEPLLCEPAMAIQIAESSDPQIRDRMAALIARRHGVVDWVRSKKENWSNNSAWGQRSIVWAASVLPKNERVHWLKSICNYPVLSIAAVAMAAVSAPESK
jgi:hypothetical protein